MKYEAIECFSGVISMRKGEVREIPNEALAQELMEAKYIKKYVPNNAKELQKALDEANETIANLNNEIVDLKKQLEEKTPNEVELSNNGEEKENADGNGEQSPDATENSGTDDVTPNNDNSDEQALVTNENNGNGEETSDANKKDSKTSNKK